MIKLIVFVVVTVLATGVLAATIGNFRFGGTTAYKALFTDVTGLVKGDDVRIAGVRVGEVDGIRWPSRGERTLAVVRSPCSPTVPLAGSTCALIRYRNLVGQRYVALTEGAGSGERLGRGRARSRSRRPSRRWTSPCCSTASSRCSRR